MQEVLEDANIKLSSVATDVIGKSGWDMLNRIEFLDAATAEYDQRSLEQMRPFVEYVPLLDTILGINHTGAFAIIAELGANMDQFPNEHHLSSWAGMCPGNNESAGKHRSGKPRHGSKWLRSLLPIQYWS